MEISNYEDKQNQQTRLYKFKSGMLLEMLYVIWVQMKLRRNLLFYEAIHIADIKITDYMLYMLLTGFSK